MLDVSEGCALARILLITGGRMPAEGRGQKAEARCQRLDVSEGRGQKAEFRRQRLDVRDGRALARENF